MKTRLINMKIKIEKCEIKIADMKTRLINMKIKIEKCEIKIVDMKNKIERYEDQNLKV